MRRALAALAVLCAPFTAAAAAAPAMEVVLTDEVLTAFLQAVSPLETKTTQQLGMYGTVQLTVTLTRPSVRVTNAAIKVRVDYRVRDASGAVDLGGVATPDLRIVAVRDKGILEARIVGLGIELPGGVTVPLEAALEPIELPGVWQAEVQVGDKTLVAEARATEVVPEAGRARVKGAVTFTPKRARARR